ncbi:MAG: Asp-tRNA(Asn)/Glu-tRNA(Gln) amidotransferase subunit GatB [Chloroflexota bacterium]
MPGALPTINKAAVEATVLTALALHCEIPPRSKFDRKNYPYPDLPKGYQISQYDLPMGSNGRLSYSVNGQDRVCGVVRVHLEEDTGKSLHTQVDGHSASLVDYNRSGIPLMEIVSEPELASPAEAREFFSSLRQILMYLGVCSGNLQEGGMRADVNVSICDELGNLGTKVEIKNLNSFRAVQRSLEYEIQRQVRALQAGETIVQETRGWLEREEETVSQRTKEYAHDYRYFPEPDLPYLAFEQNYLENLRSCLPELPDARQSRFESEFGLTPEIAGVLVSQRELADFFEEAYSASSAESPLEVAKLVTGDFLRMLHESGEVIETTRVSPKAIGGLVDLVQNGEISGKAAKVVLEVIFSTGETVSTAVDRLDLRQIRDRPFLEALVQEVLRVNTNLVETYRRGKHNVLQALVGKALHASHGKADPEMITEILRQQLHIP